MRRPTPFASFPAAGERAQTDRQEAAERAAVRQLAIQRANKMLHDDGDRVKALHGRLLLAEVMAQNGALAAHKERVAAARRAQEQAFVEQQRRALEVRSMRRAVLWTLAHGRFWDNLTLYVPAGAVYRRHQGEQSRGWAR
jgi:hypothetical protein